jgi:hypothetical protein
MSCLDEPSGPPGDALSIRAPQREKRSLGPVVDTAAADPAMVAAMSPPMLSVPVPHSPGSGGSPPPRLAMPAAIMGPLALVALVVWLAAGQGYFWPA